MRADEHGDDCPVGDPAAALNPEQRAAVAAPDGVALVVAGAGTGKTRTLTHRVAHLLRRGVDPAAILLLTFTNRAAREMLERVDTLVPGGRGALWGGTFHGVAHRLLRRHAGALGHSPAFSILDREDERALLARVVESMGERARAAAGFPHPAVLAEVLGLAANLAQPLDAVLERRFAHLTAHRAEIAEAARLYAARKRAAHCLDFDDLLVEAVRLLREHDDVADRYRRRFRHILVDEYQDTNPLQASMVRLLSGGGASVMAVGDDAQAIYSWRGADPRAMIDLCARTPEARVFRIERNYRSAPEILALANAVMARGEDPFGKRLRAARAPSGVPPELCEAIDGEAQARWVADSVDALRADGFDLADIAVLYRAHHQSLELQLELARRGMPHRLTSGVRFFEQAHVKDLAAFLRFAANPRDGVALTRVARLLPGIGEKTAEKLRAQVARDVERLTPDAPLGDVLRAVHAPTRAQAAWRQLGFTLDELRPGTTTIDPGAMIRVTLEAVYDDHLRAEYPDYEERRDDLRRLGDYAARFESVEEFLAQIALLGGEEAEPDEGARTAGDAITLSTVHQAKGLEWRAVFVLWLVEGMFPTRHALDHPDALEEERRLFYVAVTRARDRLHLGVPLFICRSGAAPVALEPSRFVAPLPPHLVRRT